MQVDREKLNSWLPWFIAPALGLLAATATYGLSGELHPDLQLSAHFDLYFDSDIPRTLFWGTTLPPSLIDKIQHPLFRWVIYPPYLVLRSIFGTGDWTTLRLLFAFNAFVWTLLFYHLARSLCGGTFMGAGLTLLALSSASAVFFLPVPDVFALGSTSILAAFALMNMRSGKLAALRAFLAQLLTFSITVTNLSMGLALTFVRLRFRHALAVSLSFSMVMGLAVIFFSPRGEDGERRAPSFKREVVGEFQTYRNQRPLHKKPLDLFLVPLSPPGLVYQYYEPAPQLENGYEVVSTMPWGEGFIKRVDPPSGSIQLLGYLLWVGLLTGGTVCSLRDPQHRPMVMALLVSIGGQLAIHSVFGVLTFLYSLHWMPLLVLLIAGLLRTSRRHWALAAILFLVTINLRTNLPLFHEATELVHTAIKGEVEGLIPGRE